MVSLAFLGNEYEKMVELTSNVQWFYFNAHGGSWEDVPEEIVIDSIDLTPSSQIGDIQIGYQIKHTDNQSQTKYYSAGTISLTGLKVNITHADVTEDDIRVQLLPYDLCLYGDIALELDFPDTDQIVVDPVFRYSGFYDDLSFDIPTLSVGEYYYVRVTWRVADTDISHDYDYHIRVLGAYRHTQYNIPSEEECTGTGTAFCYTEGDCDVTQCNWQSDEAKFGWLDEVHENGSGYHHTLGYVTREHWCQYHDHEPPGSCTGELLRDVDSGCSACSGGLSVGETVAVFYIDSEHKHPYLSCGDRVFIYDYVENIQTGIECTVTDHGDDLAIEQLDHYFGVSGCNDVDDRFTTPRMTIKLFE